MGHGRFFPATSLAALVLLLAVGAAQRRAVVPHNCPPVSSPCSEYPQITQSTPVGMKSEINLTSTRDGWLWMLNNAKYNVSINAFYVTLTQGKEWPPSAGGDQGQAVYDAIVACVKRGVKVRLVVGWPPIDDSGKADPASLEAAGVEVRRLDWTAATGSRGVLHSKFMLVDEVNAYVGSANFDWRSLSQVKELGVIISNCSALTSDLSLVFSQHWFLAQPNATVPKQWEVAYWPVYNEQSPLLMTVEGHKMAASIAVSPPSLCPPTRTSDGDAIVAMFVTACLGYFFFDDVFSGSTAQTSTFECRSWSTRRFTCT